MYAVFDVVLSGVPCSLHCFGDWVGSGGLQAGGGVRFWVFLPVISHFLFNLAQTFINTNHFFPLRDFH